MKNGHPHLMATITGSEGDMKAIAWLIKNGYEPLAKVAKTGDGSVKAFQWLKANGHAELAMVAKKIEAVKDQIQRDNEDHHAINKHG
jgi:hypothetical protein